MAAIEFPLGNSRFRRLFVFALCVSLNRLVAAEETRKLTIRVVEQSTGTSLPCRVHVLGDNGKWYFPESASGTGSAVRYKKAHAKQSAEMHVTLSAHPGVVAVPPGTYSVTAQRGKEYTSRTVRVEVTDTDTEARLELRRWIDMAQEGWYSGDTHVHRPLSELPNLVLAEDLNVALPLSYWARDAYRAPILDGAGPRPESRPIAVDATHIIYPMNTEYEIVSVGKKRHTLGAFFVLNHKTVFEEGVPPLTPVRERIEQEGALVELDKHCWPWSMAIVPLLDVDLYELSNNHLWRTDFALKGWGEPAAEYMQIERDDDGWTERGWIDYGFKNYYALLNCGFRLRPTAGTASGVHPVPLGFGRVYVYLSGTFSYEAWIRALDQGTSFVTTGPMLTVEIGDALAGHTLEAPAGRSFQIRGRVRSLRPLDRLEIVSESDIEELPTPNRPRTDGGFENPIETVRRVSTSTWIALRCFSKTKDGRPRFAHSAPTHIDIEDRPLRPRRVEVEYLLKRVQDQIERSRGVIPRAAIEEYEQALGAYRKLLKGSK